MEIELMSPHRDFRAFFPSRDGFSLERRELPSTTQILRAANPTVVVERDGSHATVMITSTAKNDQLTATVSLPRAPGVPLVLKISSIGGRTIFRRSLPRFDALIADGGDGDDTLTVKIKGNGTRPAVEMFGGLGVDRLVGPAGTTYHPDPIPVSQNPPATTTPPGTTPPPNPRAKGPYQPKPGDYVLSEDQLKQAREFIGLLNAYRISRGLPGVVEDSYCMAAASLQADQMYQTDLITGRPADALNHVLPGSRLPAPEDRAHYVGVMPMAENIAWIPDDGVPQSMSRMGYALYLWQHSPEHDAALRADFKGNEPSMVGFAFNGEYFCFVIDFFSRIRNG